MGNPEKRIVSVHVAGTNGKGSTASMISAILTAAGYKTGLYTSPHLVKFEERIRINGKPISKKELVRITNDIKSYVIKNRNTFFETATAIAFKYFADSNVDIAVLETGLGGRLDATNVVIPLVSIITSIGFEHTQILGNTLESIAKEKAGIIKKGVPCVIGIMPENAKKVLSDICLERGSVLIQVSEKDVKIKRSALDGLEVDFKLKGKNLKNIKISLGGNYQANNALTAINAIELIDAVSDFSIDSQSIYKGLGNIQKYSGLQARLSIIKKKPLIIADVAHNPDAASKLSQSLKEYNIGDVHLVFGIMKDKDHANIVYNLKDITKTAYVVKAKTHRAQDTGILANEFRKYGIKALEFDNVIKGFKMAKRSANHPVLITGSHYVVGEIFAYLSGEKYLTINQ